MSSFKINQSINTSSLSNFCHQDMPAATPVQTLIPSELFGNAVMVLEYLMCFDSMLGIREEYPDFISLGEE